MRHYTKSITPPKFTAFQSVYLDVAFCVCVCDMGPRLFLIRIPFIRIAETIISIFLEQWNFESQ